MLSKVSTRDLVMSGVGCYTVLVFLGGDETTSSLIMSYTRVVETDLL